jgi:membrane protein
MGRTAGDGAGGLLRRLGAACREDRIDGLAAEFTFFGVLSTFPGLLLVAATLGSLERLLGHDLARRSEALVLRTMDQVLTRSASGLSGAVRQLFERPSRGVAVLALATALAGLSRAWTVVIHALDLAYRVQERRSWVNRRLTGLALALSSVLLLAFVLVIVVVGPVLGLGREWGLVWRWLRWPAAFALGLAWATTMYRVAPGRRPRWRHALPGAVAATVLWLVASLGLSLYVRLAARANVVLGALGGGLIGVLWLYLLALVLLVGGELNALLDRGRRDGPPVAAPR